MGLIVRIVTGSRAGQRATLVRAVCLAGRHPECDLRFDPQQDIDVSARHAEFRSDVNGWSVRDLGSTNGTFVNGTRISSAAPIRDGDVVLLGAKGPRIEIVEASASSEATVPPTGTYRAARVRASTQERVAVAVAAETGALRRFVIGLAAVAVVGAGALVWMNQRSAAQSRDTIAALLSRSDSLSSALQRTIDAATGQQAGLDSLARVLQRERAQLSRRLQSGSVDVGAVTTQLDALDRRANQALALGASDYRDIAAANAKAVAFLVVEDQSGAAYSGTAFSITPGGLLVTNRHLVLDTAGRPPRRLGVWLAGDATFYMARLVRTAEDSATDLAFVQIDAPGPFPTVRGIAARDPPATGQAVAVIGYPLGTTLARGAVKEPSLTIGTISKVEAARIHIDAYAAQGSSGSPVFNASGHVIGVLYGSPTETGGRIIYLVPSSSLIAELQQNERGLVR